MSVRQRLAFAGLAGLLFLWPDARQVVASHLGDRALRGPAVRASQSPLQFLPHSLRLSDGRLVGAEIAYLNVPERRATKNSRLVQIAILKLRGTRRADGPPIVFLPGSPGGAAGTQTVRIASFFPFFESLRESGDVFILDYRGSGMSKPSLECPDTGYVPGRFASEAAAMRITIDLARRCADQLRANGFDLAGYTWADVAADIADLRLGLGVPQITIVAFSSGTHAALAFLRHHDRGVARLVMLGTEGPDDTQKLPAQVDRQMKSIEGLVRSDPALGSMVPEFVPLVRRVIDSLDRTPALVDVMLPGRSERTRESVSGAALAYLTSKSISGPDEFDVLPALYLTLSRGDVTILTRIIQRIVQRPGGMNPREHLFDGASGVSAHRAARIRIQALTSILGNAANFPFPDVRPAWGEIDLGPRFREAIESNVPTLFVTGSLDGNTPVTQAEEVRAGFAKSGRLIIRNGGHIGAFVSPAAWPVIRGFLAGKSIHHEVVLGPPWRFVLPPR